MMTLAEVIPWAPHREVEDLPGPRLTFEEASQPSCLITSVQLSPLPLEGSGERLASSLAAVVSDDSTLEERALSLLAAVAELRIVSRRELSLSALECDTSLKRVPLVLVALPTPGHAVLQALLSGLPDAVVIGLPAATLGSVEPPPILRRLALPLGLSLATSSVTVACPRSDLPVLDAAAGKLHAGSLSLTLTATQVDLLSLLLARPGEWVSTDELGARAFGARYAADGSLVRVHLYRLRCRLGPLSSRLRSCRGRGYLFA